MKDKYVMDVDQCITQAKRNGITKLGGTCMQDRVILYEQDREVLIIIRNVCKQLGMKNLSLCIDGIA